MEAGGSIEIFPLNPIDGICLFVCADIMGGPKFLGNELSAERCSDDKGMRQGFFGDGD